MNLIQSSANSITSYLTASGAAKQTDADIICYGLYAILLKATQIIILVIVSLPLGIFWNTAAFTMYYCVLRKYAGGAHAKSPVPCIIFFTIVAIAANLIVVRQPLPAALPIPLLLVCGGIVLIKAPVTPPNNFKSPSAAMKLKRKSRMVIFLQTVMIVSLHCTNIIPYSILLSASLGTALAALTLLPGRKKENP